MVFLFFFFSCMDGSSFGGSGVGAQTWDQYFTGCAYPLKSHQFPTLFSQDFKSKMEESKVVVIYVSKVQSSRRMERRWKRLVNWHKINHVSWSLRKGKTGAGMGWRKLECVNLNLDGQADSLQVQELTAPQSTYWCQPCTSVFIKLHPSVSHWCYLMVSMSFTTGKTGAAEDWVVEAALFPISGGHSLSQAQPPTWVKRPFFLSSHMTLQTRLKDRIMWARELAQGLRHMPCTAQTPGWSLILNY